MLSQPPRGGEPATQDYWQGEFSTGLDGTRTIEDANTWAKIWNQISSSPVPEVDFTRYEVVAVFLGNHSPGWSVEISQVKPTDSALVVEYREIAPQQVAPQTAPRSSSPYALKMVSRSALPVRFQKVSS